MPTYGLYVPEFVSRIAPLFQCSSRVLHMCSCFVSVETCDRGWFITHSTTFPSSIPVSIVSSSRPPTINTTTGVCFTSSADLVAHAVHRVGLTHMVQGNTSTPRTTAQHTLTAREPFYDADNIWISRKIHVKVENRREQPEAYATDHSYLPLPQQRSISVQFTRGEV